jgi:hypothetical protein
VELIISSVDTFPEEGKTQKEIKSQFPKCMINLNQKRLLEDNIFEMSRSGWREAD